MEELGDLNQSSEEKLSGLEVTYDSNGEQLFSYEFCDQSNAEEDKSQPEQEETKELSDSSSSTILLGGEGETCVKSLVIRIIRYVPVKLAHMNLAVLFLTPF